MTTYECNEEDQDIDDTQREARLEHGALLVEAGVDVAPTCGDTSTDVPAVHVSDVSQIVDTGNECADETQINHSNEHGIVPRAQVGDDCEDDPCQRERRYYEQHEDGVGRELVDLVVVVDEPAEHAVCA